MVLIGNRVSASHPNKPDVTNTIITYILESSNTPANIRRQDSLYCQEHSHARANFSAVGAHLDRNKSEW